MGSVYLPLASRASPGTSEVAAGCRIHVVQPSRFLPFQSDVQPLWALGVATAATVQRTSNRKKCFIVSVSLTGHYH